MSVVGSWRELSCWLADGPSWLYLHMVEGKSKLSWVSPCFVQMLSLVQFFATPWPAAHQAPLSSTVSCSLLKLKSIESVMPSNPLILCRPLLLLLSILPSIRVFSIELACRIKWPKYWSFSFSIRPSNDCSELISFRIDWFDLLAVQGTLESSSTPQFESINSLVLSHLYGGEGNGIPLQCSCLENPTDGGTWWAAVHGVAKGRT